MPAQCGFDRAGVQYLEVTLHSYIDTKRMIIATRHNQHRTQHGSRL